MTEPTIHRCPDCKHCIRRLGAAPSYSLYPPTRFCCTSEKFCKLNHVTGLLVWVDCDSIRSSPVCPGFDPIPAKPKKPSLWERIVRASTRGTNG